MNYQVIVHLLEIYMDQKCLEEMSNIKIKMVFPISIAIYSLSTNDSKIAIKQINNILIDYDTKRVQFILSLFLEEQDKV